MHFVIILLTAKVGVQVVFCVACLSERVEVMRESWSAVFAALMLGLGLTLFLLGLLIAAALSGTWTLTLWTNTIGEGWPEILLIGGVIGIQSIGLVLHWRTNSPKRP